MSYEHPIAGRVTPAAEACDCFCGDGRSELCALCDRSADSHSREAMVRGGFESWLTPDV